ncbi:MAG: hypothetical protein M1379_07715, partial [Firmicutes bacterium]|nr:hypothetical protein [Bacillota bacterium]
MRRLGLSFLCLLVVVIGRYSLPALAAGELLSPQAKELVEERTINSRTWDNGNGTRTTEFSAYPLNYQDEQGNLQPISTTLEPRQVNNQDAQGGLKSMSMALEPGDEIDFDYEVTKNIFKAFLGAYSAKPIKFQVGDSWVMFKALDVKDVPGLVEGSSIIYPDVWPNTDLRYIVQPNGVKEEIIIKRPGGPTSFRFEMKTHGVERKKTGEGYEFVDSLDNKAKWTMPNPFALEGESFDSTNAGSVKMELSEEGDNILAMLTIDPAWLNAPGRNFPVIIDPNLRTTSVNLGGIESAGFRIDFPQTVEYHAYLWGHTVWGFKRQAYFSIYSPGGDRIAYEAKWGDGGQYYDGTFWATPGSWLIMVGRADDYCGGSAYVRYAVNTPPRTWLGYPNGWYINDAQPTLNWGYDDMDDNLNQPQNAARIRVWKNGDPVGSTIDKLISGDVRGYRVEKELSTGYWSWSVQVFDGLDWSAEVQGSFSIDKTKPELSVIKSIQSKTNGIELKWDPTNDPDDPASGVVKYEIQHLRHVTSKASEIPSIEQLPTLPDDRWSPWIAPDYVKSELSFIDSGLLDNEVVSYRIRARDKAGNISGWNYYQGCSLAASSTISRGVAGGARAGEGYSATITAQQVAAGGYQLKRKDLASNEEVILPWMGSDEMRRNNFEIADKTVYAHGKYQYFVRTRNTFEQKAGPDETGEGYEKATTWSAPPYEVVVPNNKPVMPNSLVSNIVGPGEVELKLGSLPTDADDDKLAYLFQIVPFDPAVEAEPDFNSVKCINSTPPDQPMLTIPTWKVSQTLPDGHYAWRVWVSDGYDRVPSPVNFVDIDLSQLFTTFDVASVTGMDIKGIYYTRDQKIALKNILVRSYIEGAKV